MVFGDLTIEGPLKLILLPNQRPSRKLGQLLGLGDFGNQSLYDGHARFTENVAYHAAQFDVRIFKHVLQPILFSCALMQQFPPVPMQYPELPDVLVGDEAPLEEPAHQQFCDPLAVLLVRLVTGHVLDMAGVHKKDGANILEDVVDRFPVDSRALHGNVCDPQTLQPGCQLVEILRESSKGPCLRQDACS